MFHCHLDAILSANFSMAPYLSLHKQLEEKCFQGFSTVKSHPVVREVAISSSKWQFRKHETDFVFFLWRLTLSNTN